MDERAYRTLFEVSPHPMWVFDLETLAFLAVNDAAVARYGWSREEFLSLTIRDIRPAEDVPALLANVAAVTTGLDRAGRWRHRLKDGSTIDVEITSHTLEIDGRRAELVLAIDVTERRRTEEALRWLRRAVEQTDDAIFLTRLDGTIVYVNPGFERLYGYTPLAVQGQTPRVLKSGEMDPAHHAALWQTVLAGRNYRATHVNRARDGRLVTVDASITALRGADDELVGFVAVHGDISDRRRLEDERRDLEAQLAQARRIESLGTLAAGMAHDFGNLLDVVLGQAAGLARRPDDPAAVTRAAEAIRLAGERGASLVRQVQVFARPSDPAAAVVDAWAVASEVERLLRGTLPHPISIVLGPDPGGAWVRCDHTQLHQALLNLCLNARDAMPAGGTLSIAVSKVEAERVRGYCPEGAAAGDFVELSVIDTGVGMPEATLRRAFEPFFTTKPPGFGSGLGLAVVYGIAKAHGGHVAAESALQRGSSFRLFFPLSAASPVETPAPAAVAAGRTVLLVEDEDVVSDVIAAWLRDAGHEVLTARDGAEAVTAFHERRGAVDLVICDLGLPGLGGREVYFVLRKVDPAVRFVILSGFVDASERAELVEAGVAGFLEKPCRVEDLLATVGRVLGPGD